MDEITITEEQYTAAFPKGDWDEFLAFVNGANPPLVVTDDRRVADALYNVGRTVVGKVKGRPFKLFIFGEGAKDTGRTVECDLALVQNGEGFDVTKDRFGVAPVEGT